MLPHFWAKGLDLRGCRTSQTRHQGQAQNQKCTEKTFLQLKANGTIEQLGQKLVEILSGVFLFLCIFFIDLFHNLRNLKQQVKRK